MLGLPPQSYLGQLFSKVVRQNLALTNSILPALDESIENSLELLVTVPYHQELIRQDAVDESAGTLRASQVFDRFYFNTRKYTELTGVLLDGREHHTWVKPQLLSLIVIIGWAIAFWRRRG